jgi:hypothetical protein
LHLIRLGGTPCHQGQQAGKLLHGRLLSLALSSRVYNFGTVSRVVPGADNDDIDIAGGHRIVAIVTPPPRCSRRPA